MQASNPLSVRYIAQLKQQISQYKKDLQKKVNALLGELAEEGVGECETQILALGAYWSGEMLHSVASYVNRQEGKAIIRVNKDYAIFVEFGTGIVGMNAPKHPNPQLMASAGYEVGGRRDHYVTLEDGRIGWWYFNEELGKYCFTAGMASRPFMYNTAQFLRDYIRSL